MLAYQVNLLHFIKMLCSTPNISSQQIKMIKSGPSVTNVTFHVYIKFILNTQLISFSWLERYYTRYVMLSGRCHTNPSNIAKCVINWWKRFCQFKMVDCIVWCIIMFDVNISEKQKLYIWFESISNTEMCLFLYYHPLFQLNLYFLIHTGTMTFTYFYVFL